MRLAAGVEIAQLLSGAAAAVVHAARAMRPAADSEAVGCRRRDCAAAVGRGRGGGARGAHLGARGHGGAAGAKYRARADAGGAAGGWARALCGRRPLAALGCGAQAPQSCISQAGLIRAVCRSAVFFIMMMAFHCEARNNDIPLRPVHSSCCLRRCVNILYCITAVQLRRCAVTHACTAGLLHLSCYSMLRWLQSDGSLRVAGHILHRISVPVFLLGSP